MKFVCLFMLFILVIASNAAFADVRQIYKEFQHDRGAFQDSKDWAHTIYLPDWMSQQGYRLYQKTIMTEGSAQVRDEHLNPTSYSFVFRLKKKSFFLPEDGRIKVTLYATNDGTATLPTNPNNPNNPNNGYNYGYPNTGYPNTGYPNTGYPNTGYPNNGVYTANMVPILLSPQNNQTFNGSESNGKISLSWKGQGTPNRYYVKVYDNYGKTVLEQQVQNTYYDLGISALQNGVYKWQVKQFMNNQWSNFSLYRTFVVQRTGYNNNYPNTGYPNTGYPNTNYPNYPNTVAGAPMLVYPANGASVQQGNIGFQWQGNGSRYEFRITAANNVNSVIYTQTVTTPSLNYNGSALRTGTTYSWTVRQLVNNQWSNFATPLTFVLGTNYNTGYPNTGYPNTGYPNTGYNNGTYVSDTPYGWYSDGKDFYKNLNGQWINQITVEWNDFFADARCDVYIDNIFLASRDVTSLREIFPVNRQGSVLRIHIQKHAVKINNVIVEANTNYNNGYNTGYPNTGYPNTGYPNTGYPNTGYPNTGYPNTGYPNTGYPNTGYPGTTYPTTTVQTPSLSAPANGATVMARNLTLTWTGSGSAYQIYIADNTNRVIANQQVNSRSYTVNANLLRPGYTYTWKVKQMLNNQWSNYSSSFMFRVRATARSNQAALDDAASMIFESQDVEAAGNALERLDTENPEKKKEALTIIAMGFENDGKYEQAINVYREIIKVDKEAEAIMLIKIGNAYLKLDKKPLAKLTFESIMKKFPGTAEALEAQQLIKDSGLDDLEPLMAKPEQK